MTETARELQHWRGEIDRDGIEWLCIDQAGADSNTLGAEVLGELEQHLEEVVERLPRGLVIHSGKPSGFVYGADIKEFTRIETPEEAYELVRRGQQVLNGLESLPCPTVAAIDGFALGGGLELALACDYRLAVDRPKRVLGLPEVKLGIHPGFGGTVRTVRTVGVSDAMDLMLTGKMLAPQKARAIGLVDRLVAPDNWKQAAREMIQARPRPARAPLVQRLLNLAPVRPFVARSIEQRVRKRARREHYPAPYAIVELWREHGASPERGYKAEARSIAELMCTDTSRNLVRVFFLEQRLKSAGGGEASGVERVHVVGAGTMGGDIAAWCALRGLEVSLQDREEKYVRPAIERAQKLFDKRIRSEPDRKAAADRLRADVAGDGVPEADLVIEAIFEDREAKQTLYRELEPRMKSSAVLASNTSSIRLEELTPALEREGRLIGLHFFNPVAQLPLVEVVRSERSDTGAIDTGHAFVKKIGKTPLECRSAPGFVVNRVLAPYMGEAMALAEEGVPLAVIDEAAERFGMPLGPVELADSVGLDVAWHVAQILAEAFDKPLPARLGEMVDAGKLGRKSGEGFYQWEDGDAVKPDPGEFEPPEDLQDRLILPMVNEAVACLHDGVVEDADLLDGGLVFGTGFAPFRGGPLNYARNRGVVEVRQRLELLAGQHGERFLPSPGWDGLKP